MKIFMGVVTAALVSWGAIEVPKLATLSPTPSSAETSFDTTGSSRLLLSLTLSSPEDLKVREGDRVTQGQIISDRRQDRQRLDAQKRQLQLQIERLKQPVPGPVPARPVPEVAALPPASFLGEVADVERAKLKVEAAERSHEAQQRKLDLLETLPNQEVPEAVVPHEQEVLAQRQREVDQAVADQQFAEAQLAKAQADRQYQEYQHSLEMSQRAIALQQAELQRQQQLQEQAKQERDRSFQLAQLDVQQQTLETQLSALSAVRSPFNGTIQRIKYKSQTDQSLLVELVLAADPAPVSRPEPGVSSPPEPGSPAATGSRPDRPIQ